MIAQSIFPIKKILILNVQIIIFSLKVKVLHGDDVGQTGELISIDGNDGIVRMDQDKQLKILQLKFLGKIYQN